MNSQTSLSNTQHQDILVHYQTEVVKNIETLQAVMLSTTDRDSLLMNRAAFKAALQSVRDLAMIHGFECVEAIAEKIESSLRSFDKESQESPKQFVHRLRQAIEILQQVVAMGDEREAQRLLRKAECAMDYAVDNLTPEFEVATTDHPATGVTISDDDEENDLDDFVTTKSNEASNVDSEDYFDIREPEIPLLNFNHQDVYSTVSTGDEVVKVISLSDEDNEAEAIETALDEILIKKLTYELDRLSAAIERVYVSRDGIHGIQEIRDNCSTLKNESERLGASAFNDVVFPLERVARKCLQDEDDSALVLQTIARAEESLRAYLLSPTENAHELSALKAELETVLFLYEGQKDFPANRETVSSFANDDSDLFDDQYTLANKQPVFTRLRKLFGMA